MKILNIFNDQNYQNASRSQNMRSNSMGQTEVPIYSLDFFKTLLPLSLYHYLSVFFFCFFFVFFVCYDFYSSSSSLYVMRCK